MNPLLLRFYVEHFAAWILQRGSKGDETNWNHPRRWILRKSSLGSTPGLSNVRLSLAWKHRRDYRGLKFFLLLELQLLPQPRNVFPVASRISRISRRDFFGAVKTHKILKFFAM